MILLEQIFGALVAVMLGWVSSIEWRMRQMQTDMRGSVTDEQVKEIIDMKQETVKALQKQLSEDINRIEDKIDRLIERIH